MKLLISAILSLLPIIAYQQSVTYLPLFQIDDLEYSGAFRVSSDELGTSSMNYAQGPMAYDPANHSMYLVGHAHHQAIAEFSIPELIVSDSLSALNFASPRQNFTSVFSKLPNPQNLDRIGGLCTMQEDNQTSLVINAYEYYDAAGDNTQTTLILEDVDNLETSAVKGFLTFQGGAGHTSGWISPIPLEWKNVLNGDFITGQSSGIPIISRTSVGPSLFTFYQADLFNTSDAIPTEQLMDFSLGHPLHEDLDNATGTNHLWTHLSRVVYGFIVPGTRTYFTIGYSGGHTSGVCYKCTQNDGNLCGGYCAPDTSDYDQYFWLWDMKDLLEVKVGLRNPYEIFPYDYGPFQTPFQNDVQKINGGVYDPEGRKLYLAIQYADDGQGTYSNPPVIVAYSTEDISTMNLLLGKDQIAIFPNPSTGTFTIKGLTQDYSIQILDSLGQLHNEIDAVSESIDISIEGLPEGLYFIQVQNEINDQVMVRKILKQ